MYNGEYFDGELYYQGGVGRQISSGVSESGFTKKPIPESLKEFGTDRDEFGKALSDLHTNIPISPHAFVATFLNAYQKVREKRIPAELSPIFVLEYIISRIPQHVKNYDEVRKIVHSLFEGEYDQFLIDYHLGGGWFPPYPYPVRI